MKGTKGLVARYASLTRAELLAATKELDREMVVRESRRMSAAERRAWAMARRKPGRPRRGAGVKVISVSVERELLGRVDSLASQLGVSRAALIERGLRTVLRASGRQ